MRTGRRRLLQRPARVLLVAEDHTFQHGSRDPNHHWDRLVELAALVRVACFGPSGFVALMTPSNCLNVAVVFFCVSCILRTTTMRWPP